VSVFRTVVMTVGASALTATMAGAQSRPLVTEDPEVVGAGQILIEAGLDYQHAVTYPASGLQGNLWRIGTFGFSFGVSSIAEIQLDGGLRDKLAITSRSTAPLSSMLTIGTSATTSDFEDAIIGAKIRLLSETAGRPALAVKFATRLPNAQNETGLGLDTTDFLFSFLFAKTVSSVRLAGNAGFGILGDPTRGDVQNDVILYGASLARAVAQGLEVVVEVNGRANTRNNTPPVGTESHSVMRVGTRFTRGPVRFDGAFLVGITEFDPSWGFTAGLTWVFKAFTVPPQ